MNYCIENVHVDKNKLYIKGWIHEKKYKLKVVVNNSETKNINAFESRYDISAYFKEEIDDNNYGVNQELEFENKIKNVKIYLIINKVESIIFNKNFTKFSSRKERIKVDYGKFKNFIKLLWREHHFLVPPSVMRGYIKGIRNRRREKVFYNPNITSEYNNWLNNQQYLHNDNSLKLNVYGKLNGNELEESQEIIDNNSEYTLLVNGKVRLVKDFHSEINNLINDKYDIIYFDNDRIIDNKYCNPNFKPNWSIDTIMGLNYVGNVIVIKNSLLNKYKTNNIYEILLDNRFKKVKVYHLPKIMYHDYNDFKNQSAILNKYIKDNKLDITIKENKNGISNTILYEVKNNPLISIIIPTKDHSDILKVCLDSLYKKTSYKNFEVIVVNNNSTEKETFDLLDEYSKKSSFQYITINEEFNYSYLNNKAIEKAKGDYVLLLNNDIEIIQKDWLDIMVGYAQQKHIGTVGVKLLFPDDTIQHAGITMGKGGLAGHVHYKEDRYTKSSQYELDFPYDVSGCTAACLMISRKKFNEVNGLEEELRVAFNDVDFNLKVLDKGYYNIFLPNVELYHHESKSRGLDTTPEKQKRFTQEWYFMENKWGDKLHHDNYYNDNLSKDHDYMLKGENVV